jgi:hypothetical protein
MYDMDGRIGKLGLPRKAMGLGECCWDFDDIAFCIFKYDEFC